MQLGRPRRPCAHGTELIDEDDDEWRRCSQHRAKAGGLSRGGAGGGAMAGEGEEGVYVSPGFARRRQPDDAAAPGVLRPRPG